TKRISASEITPETGIQRVPILLNIDERQNLINNNVPIATYNTEILINYTYNLDGYSAIRIKSPYI
ncbi:MAG: hypothetical protein PHI86_07925, partial [Candidatus Omnitrophica bacterium]|nr:hypothetical protein [Candidatus Omnitrophota bacterium]